MITQIEIARRVGVHLSTVSKILHHKKDSTFSQETISRVFAAAEKLGYKLESVKHGHQRYTERKPLILDAQIRIYLRDGSLYDRGDAKVSDISERGAFLSEIVLPKKSIPTEPFWVTVRIKIEKKPPEIRGQIIRLQLRGTSLGFAVKFYDEDGFIATALRRSFKGYG